MSCTLKYLGWGIPLLILFGPLSCAAASAEDTIGVYVSGEGKRAYSSLAFYVGKASRKHGIPVRFMDLEQLSDPAESLYPRILLFLYKEEWTESVQESLRLFLEKERPGRAIVWLVERGSERTMEDSDFPFDEAEILTSPSAESPSKRFYKEVVEKALFE